MHGLGPFFYDSQHPVLILWFLLIVEMCGSLELYPACCSSLEAGNCLFAGSVMCSYMYASSSAIHLVYIFTGGCVTEACTCTWAHVQFGGAFAWIFNNN
jgi:hypothetical protein